MSARNKETPMNWRARWWAFTIMNPTDCDVEQMNTLLSESEEFLAQDEICPSTGTPHIQAYVGFKYMKPKKFIVNTVPRAASVNPTDSAHYKDYCCKLDSRPENARQWVKQKEKKKPGPKRQGPKRDPIMEASGGKLYPWQQEIKDILATTPDWRTVNWYWEPNGEVGKSTFVKHLRMSGNNVIRVGGRYEDIAFMIAEPELEPIGVFIDVPKEMNVNHISYKAIEDLKLGSIVSSKYKSRVYDFDPPHVFVFANQPPPLHKLSADRWNVREIINESSASLEDCP